jgi:uncharacterized protein (TIGR02117 family)
MKTACKHLFRITKRVVLGLFIFILLYVVAAFVLSIIPSSGEVNASGEEEIYILSNGVHTDIVVPVKTEARDWSKQVQFGHTILNDTSMKYIVFGWGDKGFYLETPEWSDLKFSVAFKAMFHLGTSAMHCSFYRQMHEGNHCKRILVSSEAYKKLVIYIDESFQHGEAGDIFHIQGKSYGKNDAFYEANRAYSLFYTCNTWANNALKSCGQKACLWTPSDKGIFYHYE